MEVINIHTYIDQFSNIDNYNAVIDAYEKYEKYYPKNSLLIVHFDFNNASDHMNMFKKSFDKSSKNIRIHTPSTSYTLVDYIFNSCQFVERTRKYYANECRWLGINTQSATYNPEDNSYTFRYRSTEYEENLFALVFNHIEEVFENWDELLSTKCID